MPGPSPGATPAARLPAKARLAVRAVTAVNRSSRWLGLGSGTVAGGRVGLSLDHHLIETLTEGRPVALVSGTNGKTTTTALLTAALAGASGGEVAGRARPGRAGTLVTNATGSNMPAGHVAALASGAARGDVAGPVVLEVDEGYLPGLVEATRPRVVILLNLSRDQLDRTNEVRMVAARWRRALGAATDTTVVANADDALVAWAAGDAARVVWVAAGSRWLDDASGCPACEGRIVHLAAGAEAARAAELLQRGELDEASGLPEPAGHIGWACSCGFRRPPPEVEVVEGPEDPRMVWGDRSWPIGLRIPGRFNRANAAMAAVAASRLGVEVGAALQGMADVEEVAGRFSVTQVGQVRARLFLAKNPAGWVELLDLLEGPSTPLVVGINARVADGHDPSWLWDVPFERLASRKVVATGERCHDLAVRLRYAEVAHETVPDPAGALRRAAELTGGDHGTTVDYVGNYTAFHDVWRPSRGGLTSATGRPSATGGASRTGRASRR